MEMRRSEFLSYNDEDFNFITHTADVGYLGIIDERGYPRIIPLNFVADGKDIYFHGAKEGEKYTLMSQNPKVTFAVTVPYSQIPSYWESERSAVPASHFYKSLHIRGQGSMIEDSHEKARVFELMMQKYQPEGNYEAIDPDNPIYTSPLKRVGLYKVKTEEFAMKIKFGQNMSDVHRQKVIDGLKSRRKEIDYLTLEEMRKLGLLNE